MHNLSPVPAAPPCCTPRAALSMCGMRSEPEGGVGETSCDSVMSQDVFVPMGLSLWGARSPVAAQLVPDSSRPRSVCSLGITRQCVK